MALVLGSEAIGSGGGAFFLGEDAAGFARSAVGECGFFFELAQATTGVDDWKDEGKN